MTTAYTSLLGLALPVTGELSGTWGDTVNNSITSLLDSAIAGTQTVTADTTLSTTTGAANQSRQAILLCSPASANITITAPAQSKIYTIINTSATYTVKIVGVGPTAGVTLAVSESAVVAWNGSDFIRISSNSATTGNFTVNGNLTVTGTSTLTGAVTAQGLTVGKGAGAVATNTAFGTSALAANTTGASNVAIGYQASYTNTTGVQTTAVGYQALYSNTGQNTAFGFKALYANTTGGANTAIGGAEFSVGNSALSANTFGSYNTALGAGALALNTTADNNTAVGYQAGYSNTYGAQNAYIGKGAGYTGISATGNTVLGFNALYYNTADQNTAIGRSALQTNTTGANNTAVGFQAAFSNTIGEITAVGQGSLFLNTTGLYNTAVGVVALNNNTIGQHNSGFGRNAGYNNTTGNYNTALGSQALFTTTTGSNNTAVGYQSLYYNTTASNNTAVGYQAAYSNTFGTGLLALGYQALYANTTGANGTAVGYGALSANTIGTGNSAFGYQSLNANTTGIQNTAIGLQALATNSTASNNTAVGYQVLKANTFGASNTAVGTAALTSNTTGANNVAIGHQALQANTTASNNTAVGYQAGYAATGAGNQLFGYSAGSAITTGAKNVIIGSYTGSAAPISATGSNYIVLSDGDANVRQTIDSSGNVGIGVTPSAWPAGYNALQFGASTRASAIFTNGINDLWQVSNIYYNGSTWIYSKTGTATGYEQLDGAHRWYAVGSGTAGNNATLTQPMTLDSSGNLLVGSTLSYAVNGNAAAKQFVASSGANGSTVLRYNGFGTYGAVLNLATSAGATLGTYAGAGSGNGLGSIFFGGDNGTNYTGTGAVIRATASETWTTSTNAAYLSFDTTTSGSIAATEKMRIDSSGNVGIGTTSPSVKFEVAGSGKFTAGNVSIVPSTTTNNAVFGATNGGGTFYAGLDNSTGSSFSVGNYSAVVYNSANTPLVFFIGGGEKMRLDTSGNLQMQAGAVMPYAPAPAAISAATTLTNANIQGQIISATGTTYTITMPLGTTMETLATWAATNIAYDFFVINTASGTVTMAVNTGVTSLGGLTIATGVSAHFRIRRTAANTFVLYRLV